MIVHALGAGANTKCRLMRDSSSLAAELVDDAARLLDCAPFLLRFDVARYAAVSISCATTRVSTAQASAAKMASKKLIRNATFPNGTSDARCASMTHRGKPGGCATPSP